VSHNPNEISALHLELVLREVPTEVATAALAIAAALVLGPKHRVLGFAER
jgi:hypothetical protein